MKARGVLALLCAVLCLCLCVGCAGEADNTHNDETAVSDNDIGANDPFFGQTAELTVWERLNLDRVPDGTLVMGTEEFEAVSERGERIALSAFKPFECIGSADGQYCIDHEEQLWFVSDSDVLTMQAQGDNKYSLSQPLWSIQGDEVVRTGSVIVSGSDCYLPGAGTAVTLGQAGLTADRGLPEVQRVYEKYKLAGLQVAVIKDGQVLPASYCFGWADKSEKRLLNEDTKIRVASLSKVAVVIAAMKLQEQGKLSIDDNLGVPWGRKVINEGYPDINISMRLVFYHISSLKDIDYRSGKKLDDLMRWDDLCIARRKPGTAGIWNYNNFAIGVAGTTLEKAAGQTMFDYMPANIFEPLGMDASFSCTRLNDPDNVAVLYNSDGSVSCSLAKQRSFAGNNTPGDNSEYFAGWLTVSAEDYARLIAMLANGGEYNGVRLLSEESVEDIQTPVLTKTKDGETFEQCLVLRRSNLYGRTLYYHTGNAYGVIAMASYDPETGDGLVIVSTGADETRAADGIYALCDELNAIFYTEIL